MVENDLNRVSRWGIPGWTALLALIAFISIE
jgi:hypothetical protein